MTDVQDYPAIEALIPHRGTMLLLDRVLEFAGETAVAEYTPGAGGDAWYADETGAMPAWMGIELMAQTVAAHVALSKRQQGLPPKMGALLGTRRYESSVASFAAGDALRIRVRLLLRDASGLGAYDCAIERAGVTLATATLKVFEAEDFESFVEGSRS